MRSEIVNKIHQHLVQAGIAHQEADHAAVVDELVACIDLCEQETETDLSKVRPVPVPGTFADGVARAHAWVHYDAEDRVIALVLVARICLWLAEREGWSLEDSIGA